MDKIKKKAKLIYISVLKDHGVDEKEMEKIDKYQDYRIEMKGLWNMTTNAGSNCVARKNIKAV